MKTHESHEFVNKFIQKINDGVIPLLFNSATSELEYNKILEKISVIDDRFSNCFILCTSGTTGYTKLVVHSFSNLEKTGKQFAKILNATSDDVFFSAAKMFHAYGLGNSYSIPNACGASVVFNDELITPTLACDIIDKNKVTVFCGVPRHFASMANTKTYPKSGSLRICLSAGEKLPKHIKEEFEKNTGAEIIDAVGCTETLGFMLSSGKPIEEVEIKLIDEELYVKSDSMFLGYYGEEATNLQDGWLRTGDLYDFDGNTYTHKGRANDLIKINGNKIYTNIVEQEIISMPGVKECALKLYKSTSGLDKLKLYLVCDNYSDIKSSITEIGKKNRVSILVELKDELPRTATGKIRKYKL